MLTFDEATHTYALDGNPLDGVTSVIKAAGFMPEYKPQDAEWYMSRGSMIHLAAELYDRRTLDEETLDPSIKGYLESWKKISDQAWVHIEMQLADQIYQYAGTIDRIPLLDIKSGSPAPWHKIQLGAYYGLCKCNVVPVKSGMAVYLQEDGSMPKIITYTLKELQDALKIFQCALVL